MNANISAISLRKYCFQYFKRSLEITRQGVLNRINSRKHSTAVDCRPFSYCVGSTVTSEKGQQQVSVASKYISILSTLFFIVPVTITSGFNRLSVLSTYDLMHRLLYLSSASFKFSDETLRDILTTSRKNNALSNVTGLLLYHDGSILQILEGEEITIRTLFIKIMRDSRHTGVLKLVDEETDDRDFSSWSMGFKKLSDEEWRQLSGYINLGNQTSFLQEMGLKSIQVLTMIKAFVAVNVR